ncbi:hypothetical protein L596_019171 [Steinernema carpocapsae]|nr:hypothetical protein L596_019171 [Steinernema carpocapsae]
MDITEFEEAVVVVAARPESSKFSFWNPKSNREDSLHMDPDAPVKVGDWITIERDMSDSVNSYMKLEESLFKTKIDTHGELNIRLHAFIPSLEIATQHKLEKCFISPYLGKIAVNDENVAGFVDANREESFSISVVGTRNPEEQDEISTMWIASKIHKLKEMENIEKLVALSYLEEEAFGRAEEDDPSSQYASILKFQKKRQSSGSSFEAGKSISTSSFSVISSQPTPLRSPNESSETILDDQKLKEPPKEVKSTSVSTSEQKSGNLELRFLQKLGNLLDDGTFADMAVTRYPREFGDLCDHFNKYQSFVV